MKFLSAINMGSNQIHSLGVGSSSTDAPNLTQATSVVHADASGNLTSFTTEADIPGATVSVTVNNTGSVVLINGVFDMNISNTATATQVLNGFCNWNGSDRTEQIVMEGTLGGRLTLSGVWVITGVTAGTYTAKLRASWTGTSGTGTVRQTHTGITAQVIGG